MSDPALPFQKALVAALKAAATDAGNSVFDEPNDVFPRIVVGDGESNPLHPEPAADCEYDPTEMFFQIDIWSRPDREGHGVGYPEVKRIASDVRAYLHGADIAVDGFRTELPIRLTSTIYSRDPDGKTRRARMLLQVQLAPEGDSP
jgi:hypothetical protein